jgi:hypothetical protein
LRSSNRLPNYRTNQRRREEAALQTAGRRHSRAVSAAVGQMSGLSEATPKCDGVIKQYN